MARTKRRLDDLLAAITFAEAGELETAQRLARDVFPGPAEAERILVVAGPRGFSRPLVDHAIELAGRLGYAILALSVSPGITRLLARARGRGTSLAASAFEARAAERGIAFAHTARRGDPERAVAEARRRYRRIAFLLVEPDLAPRGRFAGVNLPVFYLDHP